MNIQPIAQNPDFAVAQSEIGRLDQALAKVRLRLGELAALLRTSESFTKEDANLSAALAFAETGVVRPASLEVTNLNEERQALVAQEAALVRALERQRQARDQLLSDLSEQLACDLRPAHAAMAKRYLKLLQEADQILEEERQLTARVEAAGYQVRLRGWINTGALGRIGDSSGSVAYYLSRDVAAIAAN